MRRIVQDLDLVIQCIDKGVLIPFQIDHGNASPRTGDPRHLTHRGRYIPKMMRGQATGDQIERRIRQRNRLGKCADRLKLGSDPPLPAQPPHLFQHVRSRVHRNYPLGRLGKCQPRMPRPARHVA